MIPVQQPWAALVTLGIGGVAGGVSSSAATIALSLASAAIWGTSDFAGGLAAKRLPSSLVVTMSHSLSLVLLASLALVHASKLPDRPATIFGLLAGIACGSGVMLLYKALALGSMGLTAAVSGVLAALLPVLWGFATEGLPRGRQITGIVLAAVAIWMIARAPGAASSRQGILLGAFAGLSFGCLFILLKLAGRGGVLWPLAFSRMTSTALAASVTLVTARRGVRKEEPGSAGDEASHPSPRSKWGALVRDAANGDAASKASFRLGWPGWSVMGLIALAGLFDASGNSFYTLATRLGRLDISAVLSSLYPASTILLAALLLKERTTRSQTAGIALALVAVVLIAA